MNRNAQDAEHLRLLALFHYVLAGLGAVIACVPILHVVVGALIYTGRWHAHGVPPRAMGLLFVAVGGALCLMGWLWAALLLLAGRSLSRRRHRTFCLIVAGISCLFLPLGTVLGVFTLVVLQRPGVAELFDHAGDSPAAIRAS